MKGDPPGTDPDGDADAGFPEVEVPDDLEEFNALALERSWGDGLPLIPPTSERVERLLGPCDRDPNSVVVRVPPRWSDATLWKIAANAAMAGCRPEYLPIVVTALEAAAEPRVNLYGALATTHPCGMMIMVNGPIAQEIGMNGGASAFGPGSHANATIGRAVRLCYQNIGGSYPGSTDRSTLGSPVKFTFSFAENEAESPWLPYHVSLGYEAGTTAVTVCPTEPPHNIHDGISTDPRSLLGTFAHAIADIGTNNAYMADADLFVGICPEHAAILHQHGWDRHDVQAYLFSASRIPYEHWYGRGSYGINATARFVDALGPGMGVPMTDRAEDYRIFCIGGAGLHSCWIPTLGVCRSSTTLVRRGDGEPAQSLAELIKNT